MTCDFSRHIWCWRRAWIWLSCSSARRRNLSFHRDAVGVVIWKGNQDDFRGTYSQGKSRWRTLKDRMDVSLEGNASRLSPIGSIDVPLSQPRQRPVPRDNFGPILYLLHLQLRAITRTPQSDTPAMSCNVPMKFAVQIRTPNGKPPIHPNAGSDHDVQTQRTSTSQNKPPRCKPCIYFRKTMYQLESPSKFNLSSRLVPLIPGSNARGRIHGIRPSSEIPKQPVRSDARWVERVR